MRQSITGKAKPKGYFPWPSTDVKPLSKDARKVALAIDKLSVSDRKELRSYINDSLVF